MIPSTLKAAFPVEPVIGMWGNLCLIFFNRKDFPTPAGPEMKICFPVETRSNISSCSSESGIFDSSSKG